MSGAFISQLARWYETLSPESLSQLPDFYEQQAWFKDPFNEVSGLDRIRAIFEHMFVALEGPRFVVESSMHAADQAFMTWRFEFRLRGREMSIRGATHFTLSPSGKVMAHRDYWDTSEELYNKIPLIGALPRWLQRKLRTP